MLVSTALSSSRSLLQTWPLPLSCQKTTFRYKHEETIVMDRLLNVVFVLDIPLRPPLSSFQSPPSSQSFPCPFPNSLPFIERAWIPCLIPPLLPFFRHKEVWYQAHSPPGSTNETLQYPVIGRENHGGKSISKSFRISVVLVPATEGRLWRDKACPLTS